MICKNAKVFFSKNGTNHYSVNIPKESILLCSKGVDIEIKMLQDMLIIIVHFTGKNIQKPMKDFRLPWLGHESSLRRG